MPARRDSMDVEVANLMPFIRRLGIARQYWDAAEQIFAASASNMVADDAKNRARNQSPLHAKAAQTIGTAAGGSVTFGGVGYAMGAEFGALQYRQFERWTGSGEDSGHFFWPAIRAFRDDDMIEEWIKEIWKLVKPAFPDDVTVG